MRTYRILIAAILAVALMGQVYAHLDGAPPGHTGAPGEGTCADAGCHDSFPLNSGGIVQLWASSWQPETLDVEISVLRYEVHDHFGFQLTVTDSAGNPVGQFVISDSVRTQLTTDSTGNPYVTHTVAGTAGTYRQSAVYQMRWLWPHPERQPYTIFVTGMAANEDSHPTGDYVYTHSRIYDLPCPIVLPGDVNADGVWTAADVIVMVNFVFKGGPDPLPCVANGDVNCNGSVTSADVIYLLKPIFKGGPPPCDICNESPMPCIVDGPGTR